MKKAIVFVVFLYTLSQLAFSYEENDGLNELKFLIKPRFEMMDSSSGTKSFSIDCGLSYIVNRFVDFSPGHHSFKGVEANLDLFHIGANLVTKNNKDFKRFLNFSLLDLSYSDNFSKSILRYLIEVNTLSFKSDCFFDENYTWFKYGLGIGFGIPNDNFISMFLYVNHGYCSYKLNDTFFNESVDSIYNYSDLQFNAGLRIKMVTRYVTFFYGGGFLRVADTNPLNKIFLNLRVAYTCQKEKTLNGIFGQTNYLKKYFDVYLDADINRFYFKGNSFELGRVSLGVDIYLDFFPYPSTFELPF